MEINEFEALLGKAIEEASKGLPKGFKIIIEIENSWYNVTLKTNRFGDLDIDLDGGNGLISDIESGIRIAKQFKSAH